MTPSMSTDGAAIDPTDHDGALNLGKWDRWYALLGVSQREMTYGDPTTYYMAASFLADCPVVEDWGCGTGAFSTFCRSEYIGIDGSRAPSANRIADLTGYRSDVAGILLRHVLEHNYNWPKILDAAVASFRKKLCIILFTPFSDVTREIAHNRSRGVDAPDLSLAAGEIETRLAGLEWRLFRDLPTRSQYGVEHVYCIWRSPLQARSPLEEARPA